jgi:phosphatidylethanolamine/phosphatidyl-N-methylethanolamine N-methyltransferase
MPEGSRGSQAPPSDLRPSLADEARFFRNWFTQPALTGALSPSGRALARVMAGYVDPAAAGTVLELGPGTGPVTAALLARGVAPQRLRLIEFNADFVPLLERRFPGVTVMQGDAYAARRLVSGLLNAPLAAVVSSLPLLNRPVDERTALVADCLAMSAPGAPFVQFTYGLASPVPPGAVPGVTAAASARVWWNFPPARVWVYRQS